MFEPSIGVPDGLLKELDCLDWLLFTTVSGAILELEDDESADVFAAEPLEASVSDPPPRLFSLEEES